MGPVPAGIAQDAAFLVIGGAQQLHHEFDDLPC